MTYLAHPPVLLPIISASTLGEDNDHCDGIFMKGEHSGREALDNHNPGATDNDPDHSIDQPEWGTQRRCGGAWSGPSAWCLAGNVANVSATCQPNSQMLAILANTALSCQHKTDPNTAFLCRGWPTFTPFFF
jgi:hypothetical protein